MSSRHLHPDVLRSSHAATLLRLLLAAGIALGPAAPAQAAYGTSGRWSGTRYTRDIAIHLALLPGDASWHSRILFWGLFNSAADSLGGALWRWNPPTTHTPCAGGVDTTHVVFIDFANDPSFDPFCSGHSVLADGRLLVAGGHIAEDIGPEETSLFDPATATWSDPILMNGGRWYPSVVSMPTAGEAMIFAGSQYVSVLSYGGQWSSNSADRDTTLNICLLDDGSAWTQAIIAQQHASPWRPEVRTGHTLTGNHPVGATALFGGRDSVGNPKNDLWYLRADVKDHGIDYRWEYRTPDDRNLVAERSGHSAAIDSLGRMYVFGGLNATNQVIGALRRWRPRQSQSESPYGLWEDISVTGTAPPARQGHAAIVDTMGGRDRMLLFGGVDASGVPVDTKVWALSMNAATPAWSEITVSGGPGGRQGHTMLHVPISFDHGTTGPARRAILYGGRDDNGFKNDLWELWIDDDTGELSWSLVSSGALTARAFHTAVYDRIWKRMILTGGQTGATSWSDSTWALGGLNSATLGPWGGLAKNPAHALGGHQSIEGPLIHNRIPEKFTASGSSGSWARMDSAYTQMPWYPFMFVLPSGNLFFAGPSDTTSLLDMTLQYPDWKTTGWRSLNPGGSAVMYRPGEILKAGGEHSEPARANWRTERIRFDASDQTLDEAGWVLLDSMQFKRQEHNLTVLPNGQVLATGGRDANLGFVRAPELFDPGTLQWSANDALALSPVDRGYHSTAILLPTGQVMTAGGNDDGARFSALYCPPYLFKPGSDDPAVRPEITCADTLLRWTWGRPFTVQVADTTGIRGACLIRPGAATHGFDQNQRFVPLTISGGGTGPPRLFLAAPANANLAPPGHYLLFLTGSPDRGDVPSIARWVQLVTGSAPDACDDVKPAVMSSLYPDLVGPNSVYLSWSAPADDTLLAVSGVAKTYHLRYSTGAIGDENAWGFASPVGGMPATEPVTTYHDKEVAGLQSCTTYHFAIRADDDNDNLSLLHGTVSVQTTCGGGGGGSSAREVTRPEEGGAATGVARGATAPPAALEPVAGLMIVETARDPDGALRVAVRRSEAAEGIAPAAAEAIVVQVREGMTGWRTLARHLPATDAGPLALCARRDQGRVVFPAGYQLESILPQVADGGARLVLGEADHSRLGALSPSRLGSAALAMDDSLTLVYRPATEAATGQLGGYLRVRWVGEGASTAASERPRPGLARPERFALHANQPNPFRGTTAIPFDLPRESTVRIEVFDPLGRRVATLLDREVPAGSHTVEWDLRDLRGGRARPGVYLYRMTADGFRAQRKLSVVP